MSSPLARSLPLLALFTLAPSVASAQTPPPIEEEDDTDDWGWVYIQPTVGYSYSNLIALEHENFLPEMLTVEGSGISAGLGAGARIYFVTLGARMNFAHYDAWDLWTAMGEVGLILPIPKFQPSFRFGLGYGWMGQGRFTMLESDQTNVEGLVAELGLGFDAKLIRYLSIGGGLDVTFLNFTRQAVDDGLGSLGDVNFEEDGDAVGVSAYVHVHLTVHL